MLRRCVYHEAGQPGCDDPATHQLSLPLRRGKVHAAFTLEHGEYCLSHADLVAAELEARWHAALRPQDGATHAD